MNIKSYGNFVLVSLRFSAASPIAIDWKACSMGGANVIVVGNYVISDQSWLDTSQ